MVEEGRVSCGREEGVGSAVEEKRGSAVEGKKRGLLWRSRRFDA
jgi:hypothetical protein